MIRSFIETSLIDWDGRLSMVLFFDRCNFNCPFCQNWRLILHPQKFPLISSDEIFRKLNKKKGWIDGVVLTGGEPLIYKKGVFEIAQRLKKVGFGVKLDTNGSYPDALKLLIGKKLVDYVAMDIKAPLNEQYYIAAGKTFDLNKIKKSVRIMMKDLVDYEFRTTCVPGIIDENIIKKIGGEIRGARRWVLQSFVPANAREEAYQHKKFSVRELETLLNIACRYVPNAQLRGVEKT